jgi:hypothetical protein
VGFNSSFLTENPLIFLASVLPALIASLVIALSFRPPLDRFIERWRRPLVVLTYFATRVVLLLLVFVVLRNGPPTNDDLWWQKLGLGALHGGLPYRDYTSTQGPLFPYLMAVAFGLWNHAGTAVMIFIAFDLAVLALLYKIAKETLGGKAGRDVVWLWTVNPAVWIITVRYAQDETIVATFLLLAAYLYSKPSRWWHATVLALGVLFSKFTTAAGMFAIYTFSTRKVRDAVVATAVLAGVFAVFAVQGADIRMPFRMEDMAIEGINITVLIDRITQHRYVEVLHRPFSLLAVAVSLALLVVCRRRRMNVYDTLSVFLIALLLFSPRAFKFYRLWYLAPLTLWTVRNGKIGRYAAYAALLCLFNDFSFTPVTPPPIMAVMYVLAIAIIAVEIRYLVDILKTPGPGRAVPAEQPAGARVGA